MSSSPTSPTSDGAADSGPVTLAAARSSDAAESAWGWATAAGEPAEAGRAALGSAVIGAGLLMVSLGLFTGVASVLRAPRAAYLGYAGWSTG
ncbi:MAG TPA: hypothetical protein VHG70_09180 [Nocardioidaceae bacterium]|nr:hypothetical protein [Nocardioidaceae bacterium]